MASKKYDVVILGGGNAGMGATVPIREAGLSVAMIEAWDLGGTCPNRGCTPKKVLVAAAHALHEIELARVHGITVGEPSLDWATLIDREKSMIAGIPESLGKLMADRGVEVVQGQATFVGPNSVRVGGRILEAGHIIVATGSTPRRLPIPGAEHMITSDEVLSAATLPREVVFVGGGVIALEFSHIYARAGVQVTILEAMPRLLPSVDADAVEQVRAESERIGIELRVGVSVQRIEKHRRKLCVVFEQDGQEHAIDADQVVNGAGRVANVNGLDLEAGKIAHDGRRVAVDDYLRSTSNPAVYVCGDVLWTSPQLSPIATYEGRIVGRNIVEGPKHKPDYAGIPSCIYTIPALASVGITGTQAEERGLRTKIHINDMRGWLSSRTYGETAAWAKVIIDKTTDRILGAHMVGHASEELIHLFAFAMKHGITAAQIRDTVYGFPTFSADIKSLV